LCSEDDITNGRSKNYTAGVANCSDWGGNRWQMYKQPIKSSYCNAWYDACANDYFCGSGSYFSCNDMWLDEMEKEEVKTVEVIKENLKPWASAIIAVFAFVIVGCASLGFMIRKKEL